MKPTAVQTELPVRKSNPLSFLSRVAFICNLFFLATVLLHFQPYVTDVAAVSTIVIMGYFMALFIFNPLVNIWYLTLLLKRKKLFSLVPRWLVITNFIFLLLQIIYILFK